MNTQPTRQIGLLDSAAAFVAAQVLFGLALLLIGCRSSGPLLPPGTQAQASSVGIEIAPQGPIGPHVTFGSKAVTITTAQPENAPNLNRLAVEAPGIKLRSTVATGAVGEQIRTAGGLTALEAFSQDKPQTDVPTSPVTATLGDPQWRR